MRKTRILMALLLASTTLTAYAGQIFKYVDPQGRVHYADRPQAGWKLVDVRPPTNSQAGEGTNTGDDGAAKPGQDVARATECARKQEQIKTYRNASRIVERDNLGRDKEYTAEEREQLIAKTEAQVEEFCNPPKPGAGRASGAAATAPAPTKRSPASETVSDFDGRLQ